MTTPASTFLFLILVFPIGITAIGQVADHDEDSSIVKKYDLGNLHLGNRRTKIPYPRLKELEIREDEIYTEDLDKELVVSENKYINTVNMDFKTVAMRNFDNLQVKKRVRRNDDDAKCEPFLFNDKEPASSIWHPHGKNSSTYSKSTDCVTIIKTTEGNVIELTFVDVFRIEYHLDCAYDYLEIRDGSWGFSKLLGKICGQTFPRQIVTSGPYAWLKFHSDDTIEYEGFHINIEFKNRPSHSVPQSCYIEIKAPYGNIESERISQECIDQSKNYPLDVLWRIETEKNTKIYLNFTKFQLASPNECEVNVVQVFGAVTELNAKLAYYCGSMANSLSTKDEGDDPGNIMHVRFYVSKAAKKESYLNATFTAYRTLDPNSEDKCKEDEFDCTDNTCIVKELKCNSYANCRLKADEDIEICKSEQESIISQPHILAILIIFSLILSGMSFVFLFKCISKLYQDHKLIKEHIRQSCEDRLDSLVESRLILDAKQLQKDSEPRASLERDNHTNEMFKQQRKFSKHKTPSIDSDYIQETHLDFDDEPWRRDVDSVPIETEDVRIERNGRTRRSDISRKEESIRSKKKHSEERKEIRDVSVGAPDTKESSCQTRESLFQTDPPPSSEGSGTNSRGFSTFGYSGTTIARPSPPAQTKTSEITIELLKQVPRQDSKPHKKIMDRRPISTETTRSAPDVIIVSKPIQ